MKIYVKDLSITSRGDKGCYLPATSAKAMAEAMGDTIKGIPSVSSISLTGNLKTYLYDNNLSLQLRFPVNGKGVNHVPAIVWMTYVNKFFPKLAKAVAAEYWIDHLHRENQISKMEPIPSLDDQVFAIHSDAVAKVRKLANTHLQDVLEDIISDAGQIVLRTTEGNHNILPIETQAIDELITIMVRHIARGATPNKASESAVKYYDSRLRPIVEANRTVKAMPIRTGTLVLRLPRRS